jgi:excinuclease ABC subunit C
VPRADLPEQVAGKLKKLPASPGCYIYRDAKGDVLYIGKAISLRSRVRSYFQKSAQHGPRIARLVSKIADIEWMLVDSEVEALVLECNLIKEHRPPYNVRLRDDKSYPYIVITKEAYPRVIFTRNPKKGRGKAFGPYTSAFAVRETLQLLHKVFPLIPCGKSWSGEPEQRPCLYHHLGQCLAPCAGLAPKDDYAAVIAQVERFLQGKEAGIAKEMEAKMAEHAENLEFEQAAAIRDRLTAIRSVMERQKVMSEDMRDRDVIAVVQGERGAAIQMLYIRSGRLIGQRSFVLDGSQESAPSEAVQEFVKQYYADMPELPREILLPVEIEERRIVQNWLNQRQGASVKIEVPQSGEKARLVDLAAQNAEQMLKTMNLEAEQREEWAEQAMSQLAEALGLPSPPLRVEGYDISNIQGRSPVGSMVVAENGEAAPDEYRRFAIKENPETPNDFAMMREVLSRRLRRYREGSPKFAKPPDLIMIDGGKGQLGAALKARDDLELSIPMVGLAKKHEVIYVPVAKGSLGAEEGEEKSDGYAYRPVVLPLNSPALVLLRRLRDEAHRFAITYHRKVRAKRAHGSVLDEIPGVGPRRRRLLLRTFGSVEGIRRASLEEVASVPTMTKKLAEQVLEFLKIE